MPDLSNDLLTLWLRAKDGLPADEARELIERLAEMERERDEAEDEAEATGQGSREAEAMLKSAEAMLKSAEAERDELRAVVLGLHSRIATLKQHIAEAAAA